MAMNLVSPLSMQLHMHQQMLYQQHQLALHHYQQDEISHTNIGWPGSSSMVNAPSAAAAGPKLPDDVKVELENKKLWQQFHAETTEMIITKSGRRMFPSVQLSVTGLDRRARYCVLLELAPASDRRHKYVGGVESPAAATAGNKTAGTTATGLGAARGWASAGPAEPQPALERRLYMHPDSPNTGAQWMQHPLNFSKIKLTNNVVEPHNHVLLTSMHKYIPKIWIIRCDQVTDLRDLYNNPSSQFTFRETEFIAVTAYQNESITKLKIDNNPFAKGFRESGQSACKRKRQRNEDATSSNSEISHDEEEGNISSSDSDHNDLADSPAAKRARHQETDESCSVSSSDTNGEPIPASPPLPPAATRREVEARIETPQPRLHRPWTDDTERTPRHLEVRPYDSLVQPVSIRMAQQQQQHARYLGIQPTHYDPRVRQILQYLAEAEQRLPVPYINYRR